MKKVKITKKKLLIIIVIFVLGLFLSKIIYSKAKECTSFQESFNEGYSDVYYGNFERGNKIMMCAIARLEKPDSEVYHALSVLNTKNGNYNIAVSALEKAYELNPEEGAYYGWVLLYYYRDYKKALNILNVYDNLTPNFSDWPMGECIHYLKGLAYSQLNNYEKAIEEFDISIANTSRENGKDWVDYQVFLNKGISLFNLRKYDDAIIEFEKTIKNHNRCAEAFYFIGLSQLKLNLNDLACQNLNQAHALINQGYRSKDIYVELFHEVYEQQIVNSILKNCDNK